MGKTMRPMGEITVGLGFQPLGENALTSGLIKMTVVHSLKDRKGYKEEGFDETSLLKMADHCWCNVLYKTEETEDGTVYAKCGQEINFVEDKLGCNMNVEVHPNNELPAFRDALAVQQRFCGDYPLSKQPLNFKMEWPKCNKHDCYMQVRLCKKETSPNYGRVFFACDVKRPNKGCKTFYIGENLKYAFGSKRDNDAEWLGKYGHIEFREATEKFEARKKKEKEEQESKVKRKREDQEEEEEEKEAEEMEKPRQKKRRVALRPLMDNTE